MNFDCVIMANGLFPLREDILAFLSEAPFLIACDGAAQNLLARGFKPTAIVGDLDSLPEELRYGAVCEVHHSEEQMTNDLTKSVRFAHEKGYKSVLILGATGLREDHTLGNISLLSTYIDLFERVEMMSDFGVFIPIKSSAAIPAQVGQQISLFSITPDVEITTTGLRWDVTKRRFESWWQGTLNEATAPEFTITFSGNARIIVYKAFVDYKAPAKNVRFA